MAMTVFHGAALFVYFLLCVALILCVMFQTSKNEGLAGMMGGSSSSALFRGKKSGEETLGMWTGRLAVAYILASFFIWLIFGRGGA
jgi:protein translocase SecG subunit